MLSQGLKFNVAGQFLYSQERLVPLESWSLYP